jgi:hypothetical protein
LFSSHLTESLFLYWCFIEMVKCSRAIIISCRPGGSEILVKGHTHACNFISIRGPI